eukprot:TRINITY_DN7267_c0_g1_i1.p1 TRINITY_DN7267_c0_g1~~TRINITY_DN7267_c0_g1_i1.p1  ORF type:complete len:532 (+),score=102.01 TRINITY_DN7267_c0_g1_i1:187-1596(+)
MLARLAAARTQAPKDWTREWRPPQPPVPTPATSAEGIDVESFKLPRDAGTGRWSDAQCAHWIGVRAGRELESALKQRVSLSRGRLAQGQLLGAVHEMKQRGMDVSTQTYNKVLEVLSWTGNMKASADLLEAMEAGGVPRDNGTYAGLIHACIHGHAATSDGYLAAFLHAMRRDKVLPEDWIWLALLKYYTRHGSAGQAREIWEAMGAKGIRRGPSAWTQWIRAQEDVSAAAHVFLECLAEHKPNAFCFQAIFHAAAKNGEHGAAQRVFAAMAKGEWYAVVTDLARPHAGRAAAEAWERGPDPDADRYRGYLIERPRVVWYAYIKVFSEAGLVRQTEKAVAAMQAAGHRPDHLTYCLHVEALAVAARRRPAAAWSDKAQLVMLQARGDGILSCRRLYHSAMAVHAAVGDTAAADALRTEAASYGVVESNLFLALYREAYSTAGRPAPADAAAPRQAQSRSRVLSAHDSAR